MHTRAEKASELNHDNRIENNATESNDDSDQREPFTDSHGEPKYEAQSKTS